MHIPEALFKMLLYAPIVLSIPGPTNTLLLSSGLRVGVRRTIPLVAAETLGYLVAISLWGFSLISFASGRPWLFMLVKILCSIYILWLAIRIWSYSRILHDPACGSVTFRDVFVATIMNPKALLFASAVFPTESFKSIDYFLKVTVIFVIIVAPIGTIWSCIGSLVTSRKSWATYTPAVLRSASLVLIFFSGSLAYSTLNH
jgi:threonine/homoserine/homoserine lactone efflux protein